MVSDAEDRTVVLLAAERLKRARAAHGFREVANPWWETVPVTPVWVNWWLDRLMDRMERRLGGFDAVTHADLTLLKREAMAEFMADEDEEDGGDLAS